MKTAQKARTSISLIAARMSSLVVLGYVIEWNPAL